MRSFILGTDWWSDCDDAVAVRLLARAVKAGEVRLLGAVINACMEHSVASLKGFFLSEGIEDLPIGIDPAATDFSGETRYQERLAKRFCPEVSNADAEDGVRLYRRLLAESEGEVEILEIGFLQVAAALLKSGADDISEKSGVELVREKVKKFWVMAGKWDADGEREHNFCLNARSRVGGAEFLSLCPVPVTFLGYEVGRDVITGDTLADENDVLYRAMADYGTTVGRSSWDPMTVRMALIGDEAEAGYRTVRGTASLDTESGANRFRAHADGLHAYVIKTKPDEYYKNAINQRIAP